MICSMEGLTWQEIIESERGYTGKSKSHTIPISTEDEIQRFHKDIRDKLRYLRDKEGQARIMSLRLNGEYRLWGIRKQATLEIIWSDPLHEIYLLDK